MANGTVHGVFTTTLLAGLNGAAATLTGDITDESLGQYLLQNMEMLLDDNERSDPEIPRKPEVDYDPDPSARFVIARATPSFPAVSRGYPVRLHFRAADLGKTMQIADGNFKPVRVEQVQQSPWNVDLPRGLYTCSILGERREMSFPVRGAGEIDVTL